MADTYTHTNGEKFSPPNHLPPSSPTPPHPNLSLYTPPLLLPSPTLLILSCPLTVSLKWRWREIWQVWSLSSIQFHCTASQSRPGALHGMPLHCCSSDISCTSFRRQPLSANAFEKVAGEKDKKGSISFSLAHPALPVGCQYRREPFTHNLILLEVGAVSEAELMWLLVAKAVQRAPTS